MSIRRPTLRLGSLRLAPFLLSSAARTLPRITTARCNSTAAPVPATVADGSFWRSLVPKPLRKENRQLRKQNRKHREWNPATFFIVMFLLIGSMSIQMIALRNSFDRYMRQAEARIATLREVVEKIQRGEAVDVEKELGTGDAKKEADWEEMLKAIERDEAQRKVHKQEKPNADEPSETAAAKEPASSPEPAPAKPKTGGTLGNFF